MRPLLSLLAVLLCFSALASAQSPPHVSGFLLDKKTGNPLPYANIHVLHQSNGVISNESGYFSLNTEGLKATDTIRFQYIGYTPVDYPLHEIDSTSTIYLQESMERINETIIFGSTPNPESIVKKVLLNKEKNYTRSNSKRQLFIRQRHNSNIKNLKLGYTKSSFSALNADFIHQLEEAIPKHSTSYTDFLGNFYTLEDSANFKLDPIKTITLTEEDATGIKQVESRLNAVINNTKTDEYWKIKTGILSSKIDIGEKNDSTENTGDLNDERPLPFYKRTFAQLLRYANLDNEDDWGFLHNTAHYQYTIVGGTRINEEAVYIIDFEPNKKGVFKGRMYIGTQSYALIRADYHLAPNKTQEDFHLLGVGYSEDGYNGSIYFEKKDSTYTLKYLSKRTQSEYYFNRNLSVLKKKKRFLLDKKLHQLKLRLNLLGQDESATEVLVLEESSIDPQEFSAFKEAQKVKVQHITQFDDTIWKDVNIIAPTKQMREYQKQ